MIEKYQTFFAENGITSTSANHLCNVAREYVALAKADMSSLNFITIGVGILGSNVNPIVISNGTDNLNKITEALDNVAKSNSFIAYMQEAIKAKNTVYTDVQNTCLSEYVKEKGIEMPSCPHAEDSKSFDSFFSELSIKEKARYYALEANAAVIGKMIHQDGPFHKARKQMFDVISSPAYVEGDKLYHRTIIVDQNKVEELYFNLQKRHRSVEAELNSIKNSIEIRVQEYNANIDKEYSIKRNSYSLEAASIQNKFSNWKNEELKQVSKLKIAIPDMLKDFYNFLSNF